jgi:hypothetical protein
VLRRISGRRRDWKKQHNEELRDLYSSPGNYNEKDKTGDDGMGEKRNIYIHINIRKRNSVFVLRTQQDAKHKDKI